MTRGTGLLAQAASGGDDVPGWLRGSVELPFEVVGGIVGVLLTAALVYYAIRITRDRNADQRAKEEESARGARRK